MRMAQYNFIQSQWGPGPQHLAQPPRPTPMGSSSFLPPLWDRQRHCGSLGALCVFKHYASARISCLFFFFFFSLMLSRQQFVT